MLISMSSKYISIIQRIFEYVEYVKHNIHPLYIILFSHLHPNTLTHTFCDMNVAHSRNGLIRVSERMSE